MGNLDKIVPKKVPVFTISSLWLDKDYGTPYAMCIMCSEVWTMTFSGLTSDQIPLKLKTVLKKCASPGIKTQVGLAPPRSLSLSIYLFLYAGIIFTSGKKGNI